jgi:hypothetical protein
MDLFCPHCSKRVTVPDDKSGQVMSCPLCSKQFMAPSLAPPPAPPPPPPPVPLPPVSSVPVQPPPQPAPLPPSPQPPAPPLPPGDYTRTFTLRLREDWLAFVPAACVVLIFILSFFNWHTSANVDDRYGLWGMAWRSGPFLGYLVLMLFPTLLLVIASVVLDKAFMPPQIAPFSKWKYLAVGGLLLVTFLLLCIDYLTAHLVEPISPIAVAMKIAFRLHFIAMASSFVLFWLQWRKASNLPEPKCDLHW